MRCKNYSNLARKKTGKITERQGKFPERQGIYTFESLVMAFEFLLPVFIGLKTSLTAVFFGTAKFGAGLKIYDREKIKDLHVMF
jgi:hypothetical protein